MEVPAAQDHRCGELVTVGSAPSGVASGAGVSARLGNYQYNPQYGLLLTQPG